jgi:hypothetical protein
MASPAQIFLAAQRALTAAPATRPLAPRSFVEVRLIAEIEQALATGNVLVLPVLDRLRDAAGLPADPRVMRLLSASRHNRRRARVRT